MQRLVLQSPHLAVNEITTNTVALVVQRMSSGAGLSPQCVLVRTLVYSNTLAIWCRCCMKDIHRTCVPASVHM
jgi:hypothetical protein